MTTVIKFPVYIEVVSESRDRKQVSDATREILYPVLLRFLADAKFHKKILGQLHSVTNGPVDVRILTEIDLIRSTVKDDNVEVTQAT